MRSKVILPNVGLYLHDSAGGRIWTIAPYEPRAQQPAGGCLAVVTEQVAREWAMTDRVTHLRIDRPGPRQR